MTNESSAYPESHDAKGRETNVDARAEFGGRLRLRRTALGFTREQMAAGIGLRLNDVHEIEQGVAPRTMIDSYVVWLAVMESWPPDIREGQRQRARLSQRFGQAERQL